MRRPLRDPPQPPARLPVLQFPQPVLSRATIRAAALYPPLRGNGASPHCGKRQYTLRRGGQAVGNRQPSDYFFLPDTIFCLSLQSEDSPCRTRNCIKYNAIHHTTRSVSARLYRTNAKKSTLDHSTDTDTPGHRRDVGRTMLMHRTSVCRVPVGRRLLSHRQQLQDDSHNATVRLCAHCRNNPRPTPAAISGHDPPPCGQADATPPVAHTAGGPRPRAPRPLGRNDCHTEGLTLSSKRH